MNKPVISLLSKISWDNEPHPEEGFELTECGGSLWLIQDRGILESCKKQKDASHAEIAYHFSKLIIESLADDVCPIACCAEWIQVGACFAGIPPEPIICVPWQHSNIALPTAVSVVYTLHEEHSYIPDWAWIPNQHTIWTLLYSLWCWSHVVVDPVYYQRNMKSWCWCSRTSCL